MDPWLIVFGFGVGILVGTTGMGGGSLMTPLLILVFGIQPVVAVGSDLAYAAVTKTAGGALHYRRGGPSNTTVVMYDEIALSRWVEEAVRKAGITVLLGAILRGVARDGARIRHGHQLAASVAHGSGELANQRHQFRDAPAGCSAVR